MLNLYLCIRDQHDWRLVALAGVVCVLSTLVAVFLLHQAQVAEARARIRWLLTSGLATGFGIWATHFIAMLGYDPGVVAGYRADFTVLSLLIAVLATTAGFLLVFRRDDIVGVTGGGILAGGGIAAMHYTGMQAVELPGQFLWSPGYVLVSLVGAIVPTIAALHLVRRAGGAWARVGSALLLTVAILTLHFTGMTALTIIPDQSQLEPIMLMSPMVLGATIGGMALVVLLFCLLAANFNHRAQAAIRESGREFDIFAQGITDCAIYMLDQHGRVTSWNAGAERLKGFSAAEMTGASFDRFYTEQDRKAGLPAAALAAARLNGKFVSEGWRVRKDGKSFWAHVTIEKVLDEDGKFLGFAKITRDMSQFKADQDRMARATYNLDIALAHMPQGLCLFDANQKLILANRRFADLWRLPQLACRPGKDFTEIAIAAITSRTGVAPSLEHIQSLRDKLVSSLADPSAPPLIAEIDDMVISIANRPLPDGGWVSTFEDVTVSRRGKRAGDGWTPARALAS